MHDPITRDPIHDHATTIAHRTMSRIASLALFVVGAPMLVACGDQLDAAVDTLPPMFTTTTTSTTPTDSDLRRKFYEVKAGDNVNEIARRAQVPAQEIIRLNDLPANGYLQVGQIIELPVDMVLIEELPPPPEDE